MMNGRPFVIIGEVSEGAIAAAALRGAAAVLVGAKTWSGTFVESVSRLRIVASVVLEIMLDVCASNFSFCHQKRSPVRSFSN